MIGRELVAFLESPCSLIVGTVDADGFPDACRAWGVEVLDERNLRVLLSTQAPVTRRNVEGGGAIALTATHFMTFESVQLKGHATRVGEAGPADRIRFERYVSGATRAIAETDGTPEELVARFITADVYVCHMDVDSVYDQTPGRSAGTQLAPEPS